MKYTAKLMGAGFLSENCPIIVEHRNNIVLNSNEFDKMTIENMILKYN